MSNGLPAGSAACFLSAILCEALYSAAVSAISFGALNALEDIDEDFDYEIDRDEAAISLSPKGAISDHDETVLETLIIQLKTIEASYPEAITIQERK